MKRSTTRVKPGTCQIPKARHGEIRIGVAEGDAVLILDGYQEPGDDVRAIQRLRDRLTGQKPPVLREVFPMGESEETRKRIRAMVERRLKKILAWRKREERRTGIYLDDELIKAASLPAPERDRRIQELEQIWLDRERRQPRLYVPRERYHEPGCTGRCHGCESIEDFHKRAEREAKYLGLEPLTIILTREHVRWLVKHDAGQSYAAIARAARVHRRAVERGIQRVRALLQQPPKSEIVPTD